VWNARCRGSVSVPTSAGCGSGCHGVAALPGVPDSRAGNVTVLNTDNGFGSGHAASLINRL